MGGEIGGKTDTILLPFLSTSVEAEAEEQLVDLLVNHATPIIESTVSAQLGHLEPPQMDCWIQQAPEFEDVVSEVILKILDRLRRLKEKPEEAAIGNFKGYVYVAASNACNAYFRARHPNRARYKCKLRYVLSHNREFALWEAAGKMSVCGFSE